MKFSVATKKMVALGLLVILSACGSDEGDGEGGQCQPCRGAAPQCDSGKVCSTFRSNFGDTRNLCVSPGTTECTSP